MVDAGSSRAWCLASAHFTCVFAIKSGLKTRCRSGLPDGKLLSLACPRESNQREGHPAAPVLRTSHVVANKAGGCGTRAARSDSPRRLLRFVSRYVVAQKGKGGGSNRIPYP
jgi:hypothetical protein